MRKLSIIVIFLVTFIFLGGPFLIDYISKLAFRRFAPRMVTAGVYFEEANFDSPNISSINAVTWKNIDAKLFLKTTGKKDDQIRLFVTTEAITFKARSLALNQIEIVIKGAQFKIPQGSSYYDYLEASLGNFSIILPVNMWQPKETFKLLQLILKEFIDNGETDLKVIGDGRVIVKAGALNFNSDISFNHQQGKSTITYDTEELKKSARHFSSTITDEEIELMTKYPTRILTLFIIKEQIELASSKAWVKDQSVPEQAIQQTLWGYYLTKKYGPEFAEELTIAHLRGATDTKEELKEAALEYSRIGSGYALSGVKEKDLMNKMSADLKEKIEEKKKSAEDKQQRSGDEIFIFGLLKTLGA